VSAIVPTLGREEPLCETLSSLFNQDYPNFEIVVVDQTPSHSSHTRQFLEQNASRLRYIRLAEPCLADALNTGIVHAQGDIIVLLDDDVIASQHLVSAHVAAYTDESIGGVAGQILKVGQDSSSVLNPGMIDRKMNIWRHFDSNTSTDVQHAPGANFSIRRELLFRAGLVEPRFRKNAMRWETDLSLRLRHLGFRIRFEPSASLVHVAAPKGGCQNRGHVSQHGATLQWYYWMFHNNYLLAFRHRKLFSWQGVIWSPMRQAILNRRGLLLVALAVPAAAHAYISYLGSRKTIFYGCSIPVEPESYRPEYQLDGEVR
jgi:GT2 family glycosyltransferase